MKKLLLLLCIISHTAFCETPRIDSLKRELKKLDKLQKGYSQDTARYSVLKAVMTAYGDVSIDSSVFYNQWLIRFCKEKGLREQLVYAHYFTGVIYEMQGKHHESIRSNYATLALAEKQKQYIQVATIFGVLAHSHASLHQYGKALELCQKGLDILHAHSGPGAYKAELALLNTKGVIYRETGKLNESLQASREMYNLARTKPFYKWYEAHGLQAIGLVYREQGNLTAALEYHKRAMKLANKIGSTFLEANVVINIANICIRQKKWQEALIYSIKAEQMAIHLKNSSIVMEAKECLYKIFKNTGKPFKALAAYENFVTLKDSLLEEKNQQRIDGLQEQYETGQKANELQQRVQLLAKENENQKLAETRNVLLTGIIGILLISILLIWNNRRLQAKNQELTLKNQEIKEAHFKGQSIERKRVALELHDNVSSLLSAVSMSVQSINPQNMSEAEQSMYRNVKHLIQNAYAEVRNISHNILPAELEREGLSSILKQHVYRLNENLQIRFSVHFSGMQERLPAEIEYNMYSIVLELINNVIKHAKATSVTIKLVRNESGIDLYVTDNGIGFSQNQNKNGVGLQNVHARLESLGGSFTTVNLIEQGTQIVINIPVEPSVINRNVHVA
jgi:signal transduction histidine kinase